MQFLSDVTAADCNGQRYRPEILEVGIEARRRWLNVAQVLELTVSEAVQLFASERAKWCACCSPWWMWGWTTLQLGRRAHALRRWGAAPEAGGFLAEAAKTVSASRQPLGRKGQLFIFDEPTTGLHLTTLPSSCAPCASCCLALLLLIEQ